ncbi:hypothetical protein ElyMa_006641500 [Elysia marginata]|uniref:MADF domain-containing protein n=1 Tax=Elysia marginata TaxID=1093978 RepID=A0AAV4IKQ9_9GAST|nr:hypothetical protein ElyMa_006641500 [Elysia marginata]
MNADQLWELLIDPPKTEWFEQKLDHFKPTDTRTWKQVSYRINCLASRLGGHTFSRTASLNHDRILDMSRVIFSPVLQYPARKMIKVDQNSFIKFKGKNIISVH